MMTTSPVFRVGNALRLLVVIAIGLSLAVLLARSASAMNQDEMEHSAQEEAAFCETIGGKSGVWYYFDANGNIESVVVTCDGSVLGSYNCAVLTTGTYCGRAVMPETPVTFPNGGTSQPVSSDPIGPPEGRVITSTNAQTRNPVIVTPGQRDGTVVSGRPPAPTSTPVPTDNGRNP